MSIFEKRPLMIAGPCSVESEGQIYNISSELKKKDVDIIRAGIWKPRTRPGAFEGVGERGLKWLSKIKTSLNVKFAIEVASPKHVELALKAGIEVLWIGARSTTNPFIVQSIAESLKGVDIPIMVKNPINPDLGLWIGAIERLRNVGIKDIAAIHRGFSTYNIEKYRNKPIWNLAIDFRCENPDIPLICDPSHISGDKRFLHEISQQALDLNYHGLMIEVHPNPSKALSDPKQQITPKEYSELIKRLKFRELGIGKGYVQDQVEFIREEIDVLDHGIVLSIQKRMELIKKSALLRLKHNIPILQLDRWEKIAETRPKWLTNSSLNPAMIQEIFKSITSEAIKMQIELEKTL